MKENGARRGGAQPFQSSRANNIYPFNSAPFCWVDALIHNLQKEQKEKRRTLKAKAGDKTGDDGDELDPHFPLALLCGYFRPLNSFSLILSATYYFCKASIFFLVRSFNKWTYLIHK